MLQGLAGSATANHSAGRCCSNLPTSCLLALAWDAVGFLFFANSCMLRHSSLLHSILTFPQPAILTHIRIHRSPNSSHLCSTSEICLSDLRQTNLDLHRLPSRPRRLASSVVPFILLRRRCDPHQNVFPVCRRRWPSDGDTLTSPPTTFEPREYRPAAKSQETTATAD